MLPLQIHIHEIARRAAAADDDPSLLALRAGSPKVSSPPSGIGDIMRKGSSGGKKLTPGLTLIKNAAAFRTPAFITTNTHERDGHTVRHYATVQRTDAQDVEHESFYAAAGDHIQPGHVETRAGHRYQYFWRVTEKISDLIRAGEQEHLDDARRAFELTYKRIADEINALVGTRFGPADTPDKATQLAEAALAAKLPRELGTNPANWTRVLDRLLDQSKTRDTKGWHYMQTGEVITEKDRIVEMVVPSTFAQIGVASDKVVNL
ncbi:MAG TPA: hypothetical protein VGL09_07655 [Methylomirabilota bacterium]|jgi:hypothetical protein